MYVMKNVLLIIAMFSIFFLVGCGTGVVSREFREEASAGPPVSSIFKEPDAYAGQKIVLGGVIVNTTNENGETLIEVIEKPLDYYEKPEFDGTSRGRFIVVHKGYLKRNIYSKGREITVAGEVAGKIKRKGMLYLMINSKELHIFKPRRKFEIRLVPGEFQRDR
jgi:outer membrane lipoprotein